MKNTTIFAVILSAFMLASCGTSHDVVDGGLFQKRKYNKGYHISKKAKTTKSKTELDEEVASNFDLLNSDSKSTETEVVTIPSNQVMTAESTTDYNNEEVTIQEEIVIAETNEKSTVKTNNGVITKNNRNMKRGTMSTFFHSSPISVDRNDNTSDDQNTTDNTLLLVIIAFFIPFLAVGLYDGITGRFWLSLILTFLFWLPGFIYALIVILE